MGGINSNTIAVDAMDRGENTISRYMKVCFENEAQDIKAFGTSALRDATNTPVFIKRIKDNLGLDIHVISGEEEAKLIFIGVNQVYDFNDPGVVIDIGGGSTEIIFANEDGVQEMESLNIGVSRLYQKYDWNDPLTASDIELIRQHLQEESKGFLDNRNELTMIGSSGSFETFWELINQQHFPIDTKVYTMNLIKFKEVLTQTINSTLKERESNPFIIPIRKIMAPIIAVKTAWLMEKLNTKKILISPFSLKEGALFTKTL